MRTQANSCHPDPSSWLVVSTQPHREHVAIEHLIRQGFPAYCPRLIKRVRHARRATDVLKPMFPGYVFVEVDPGVQRWRPILSTIGVRTIVRFGDRVGVLDPQFIDSLKAREVNGAVTLPARPYQLGEDVRLAGGVFDGLVAQIIAMDEKERLVVLMDLLGQSVRVVVTATQVSALSSAPRM